MCYCKVFRDLKTCTSPNIVLASYLCFTSTFRSHFFSSIELCCFCRSSWRARNRAGWATCTEADKIFQIFSKIHQGRQIVSDEGLPYTLLHNARDSRALQRKWMLHLMFAATFLETHKCTFGVCVPITFGNVPFRLRMTRHPQRAETVRSDWLSDSFLCSKAIANFANAWTRGLVACLVVVHTWCWLVFRPAGYESFVESKMWEIPMKFRTGNVAGLRCHIYSTPSLVFIFADIGLSDLLSH